MLTTAAFAPRHLAAWSRHVLPLLLALCAAAGTGVRAQTAAVPPAGVIAATYDVVSIRPNKTGGNSTRISINEDQYAGTNVTVKMLMQYAYDLKTDDLLFGMPGWAGSTHYDVEAKMDAETVAARKTQTEEQNDKQGQAMMQALLADRFGLKAHHESRELPTFALVLAKGGITGAPGLKQSAADDTYANGLMGRDGQPRGAGSFDTNRGSMHAQAVPIANLVIALAQRVHRQIVDQTGLTGKFDLSLTWAPDDDSSPSTETGPSLTTALQEQLGLKLESTKAKVDTITVDHIDQPTEN